jgi:hypothetical protein
MVFLLLSWQLCCGLYGVMTMFLFVVKAIGLTQLFDNPIQRDHSGLVCLGISYLFQCLLLCTL